MRKFILIAALVLVSATAQAATRGLTLASNELATAEQPKPVETPKEVERPAASETTVQQPTADQGKPVAAKSTPTTRAGTPKRKRETTEARVIRELHRHGIYW